MTAQPCDRCGRVTEDAQLVREVHSASGGGRNIYACGKHASLYPPEPDILDQLDAARERRRNRLVHDGKGGGRSGSATR